MKRASDLVANVSGVISDLPGELMSVNVTNTHNAALYFMLFDSDDAPAADEDPVFTVAIAAGVTTSISGGRDMFGPFRTGIAWGTSSTADDYTANGDAKFAVHAVYR